MRCNLSNACSFTGKQLHCFLGLGSLLASSFHYWKEGPELGQDHPTDAQGVLEFFSRCAWNGKEFKKNYYYFFFFCTCKFFFASCLQVHIEFTEGEDKITLEGPTKDVQMVQSQIEVIITDLVSLFYCLSFLILADIMYALVIVLMMMMRAIFIYLFFLYLYLKGKPHGLCRDQRGPQVPQTPDWKRRCQQ